MKVKFAAGILFFVLMLGTAWAAEDSILLEDGTLLEGNILLLNKTEVIMSVGNQTERIPVSDIRQINFAATLSRF